MSAPFVPSRKHGESELDHLLRKEALWGLWQADALERMQQQDQTIDAITMKLFGKKGTIYRLLKNGEVVGVFDNKAEADAALSAA